MPCLKRTSKQQALAWERKPDQRSFRTLPDFRYSLRAIARSPLFASIAIISLALGIGANTAIFTLMDRVMLRNLPVKNPGQLVMLYQRRPHNGSNMGPRMNSYPIYHDYQKRGAALTEVFCRRLVDASVTLGNQTDRVDAEMVSGNYFSALGIQPAVGRLFNSQADDRVYMGHPVVALSYDYWVTRFNRNPNVVGTKILVNNYPTTVVGVSARGFAGLDPSRAPQIRVPILMEPVLAPEWFWFSMDDRRTRWVQVFARESSSRSPSRKACSRSCPPKRIRCSSIPNPDLRILLFTLALTLLTSLIFGLVPAMRSSRPDLWTTLKDAAGSIAVREVLVLLAIGLAIGLPSAIGLGRFVSAQLYEIKGSDPWIACATIVALILVATAAGFIPATCASRIDPILALRYE